MKSEEPSLRADVVIYNPGYEQLDTLSVTLW